MARALKIVANLIMLTLLVMSGPPKMVYRSANVVSGMENVESGMENVESGMENIESGMENFPSDTEVVISDLYKEIEALKKTVADLANQVYQQQVFVSERIRTDGDSGVKVIRSSSRGLHNYNSATHVDNRAFAMHDHSDYDRTIGLGELAVVLNGVDFRTRHNDYKLVMPSTTSQDYHAVEDIPFPEVPPEVLNKNTVEEQSAEMKEWFRAFKNQNSSERNYTKYFQPVLCYLEGAWTNNKIFKESFASERHFLNAVSWEELHEKARYMGVTGYRARKENIAYLPTTIMQINKRTGVPEYAQWNYRILCHPIGFDIPFSHFKQVDDLAHRRDTGRTMEQVAKTRAARFEYYDDSKRDARLIDHIVTSIPGCNNYGANLTSYAFDELTLDPAYRNEDITLNSGYYHRSYKFYKSGASGATVAQLGFNDRNMWMAQTTNEDVAPISLKKCKRNVTTKARFYDCKNYDMRVSYAIPLEVIYMTPLLSWNPYNLTYNKDIKKNKGSRDGTTKRMALIGIDKTRYYQTPVEFFSGPLDKSDKADTVKSYIYVLDPSRRTHKVSASGTRIFLQNIDDLGQIRLRYPIAPIHGEGSSVWKELNALKDTLVRGAITGMPKFVVFQMSWSVMNPPGEHTHEVHVTFDDFYSLHGGMTVNVTTEFGLGHTHDLVLSFSSSKKLYTYTSCDRYTICPDGHPTKLFMPNGADY